MVTWDGGGGNDNIGNATNWNPDGAPATDLVNTMLQFDGAVRPTPNLGVAFDGVGTITNTGLINGDGAIAKPVTNSGTGELRTESGKTLQLTGANGTNTGKVNLQGGRIEFSQALTNSATDTIQGRGTAAFTGGLTNQGSRTRAR